MSDYVSPQIKRELAVLGQRLADLRLALNRTQAETARQAGIGVSSLRRLESGENASLDTFLRVLTALELSSGLSSWIPDAAVRPVDRVKLSGQQRQRASGSRIADSRHGAASAWAWGDESASAEPSE